MLATIVFAALMSGQAPFKATAKLGAPFALGNESHIIGSNRKIDVGDVRVLTVHSARFAEIYPNVSENVSAGPGEKLLVVRGSLGNPSSVLESVTSSSFLGIRFWAGRGKGEFKYAGAYDPQTHAYLHRNLKKGQGTDFECVVRVPANYGDMRVGFYFENRSKIAWYDFNPVLGKMNSDFSPNGLTLNDSAKTAKGQIFGFDIYRMKVLGVSEPDSIGGMSKGSQRLGVVTVEVANAMMLPVRWGWQYIASELVMKDGSVVSSVNDLIDKATGKTWSGDIGVGATAVSQFVFRLPIGGIPMAFRLKLNSSKRTIEVPL